MVSRGGFFSLILLGGKAGGCGVRRWGQMTRFFLVRVMIVS